VYHTANSGVSYSKQWQQNSDVSYSKHTANFGVWCSKQWYQTANSKVSNSRHWRIMQQTLVCQCIIKYTFHAEHRAWCVLMQCIAAWCILMQWRRSFDSDHEVASVMWCWCMMEGTHGAWRYGWQGLMSGVCCISVWCRIDCGCVRMRGVTICLVQGY